MYNNSNKKTLFLYNICISATTMLCSCTWTTTRSAAPVLPFRRFQDVMSGLAGPVHTAYHASFSQRGLMQPGWVAEP